MENIIEVRNKSGKELGVLQTSDVLDEHKNEAALKINNYILSTMPNTDIKTINHGDIYFDDTQDISYVVMDSMPDVIKVESSNKQIKNYTYINEENSLMSFFKLNAEQSENGLFPIAFTDDEKEKKEYQRVLNEVINKFVFLNNSDANNALRDITPKLKKVAEIVSPDIDFYNVLNNIAQETNSDFFDIVEFRKNSKNNALFINLDDQQRALFKERVTEALLEDRNIQEYVKSMVNISIDELSKESKLDTGYVSYNPHGRIQSELESFGLKFDDHIVDVNLYNEESKRIKYEPTNSSLILNLNLYRMPSGNYEVNQYFSRDENKEKSTLRRKVKNN